MDKGFMMRVINSRAQNGHALYFGVCLVGMTSCNIADRRCDHRYFMSACSQQARKFMVTCAAGLINGCECLVNDENMHGKTRIKNEWRKMKDEVGAMAFRR